MLRENANKPSVFAVCQLLCLVCIVYSDACSRVCCVGPHRNIFLCLSEAMALKTRENGACGVREGGGGVRRVCVAETVKTRKNVERKSGMRERGQKNHTVVNFVAAFLRTGGLSVFCGTLKV